MQFRLRPTLLTATAALVVATMAVTGLLLQHYIGQMIERLLTRQFDIVAGGAAMQVETVFDNAVNVLKSHEARAALGLLPLDEPARLGRALAERLRQEPHLAWISYGDLARNRFVGATRRSDGAIMVNIAAADVGSGVPSERIALPDGSWRPAGLSPRKAYAVVDQPWFKAALAADGMQVSEPYEFTEADRGQPDLAPHGPRRPAAGRVHGRLFPG